MRSIALVLFSILIPAFVLAQLKVVDHASLNAFQQRHAQADADGKVLVLDDEDLYSDQSALVDTILVPPPWPLITAGGSKLGGIYAKLDVDDEYEILFNIGQQTHAWKLDGSVVPGWPKALTLYPDGPPAFGDIDGDGEGEVVVSTRSGGTGNSGALHAFRKDGTVVTGFPVTLPGGITNNPCLADVDNDGAMEIIVTLRNYPNGSVGVYKGDGSSLNGWPQGMDYIPASACAAGDIDGDGFKEIVAESYYKVWAWKPDGTPLTGFPYTPSPAGRVFSYSTPVLVDLDDDGFREIIVGDHSLSAGNGMIHVLTNNGQSLPGWPQTLNYWIYSPPSVGDIDADGFPDVAVGDQVLSGSPVDQFAAWNAAGISLPGFPVMNLNAINCQALILDLDGDGEVEVIFDDNTGSGTFQAYNHDATPMVFPGWPLSLTGQPFYVNPFVADLDRDGNIEMVANSRLTSSDTTYTYLWESSVAFNQALAFLSVLQFNTRHDGVYGPATSVGQEDPLKPYHNTMWSLYPNPFSNDTKLEIDLASATCFSIEVYNLLGARMNTLFSGRMEKGKHAISWNGTNANGNRLFPGIYFISLQQGNSTQTKKIILYQ